MFKKGTPESLESVARRKFNKSQDPLEELSKRFVWRVHRRPSGEASYQEAADYLWRLARCMKDPKGLDKAIEDLVGDVSDMDGDELRNASRVEFANPSSGLGKSILEGPRTRPRASRTLLASSVSTVFSIVILALSVPSMFVLTRTLLNDTVP